MLYTVQAFGTSVFVARFPDRLVVAADTLAQERGSGSANGRTEHVCKIVQSGAIYFVIIGVDRDNLDIYNADRLARQIALKAKSVTDAGNIFSREIVAPLEQAATRLRRESPNSYDFAMRKHRPLQVVFMGIENGDPTFSIVDTAVTETKRKITAHEKITVVPSENYPASDLQFETFGQDSAAVKLYKRNNLAQVLPKDPVGVLRTLVETEIRDDPADVGAPIDILTISPIGTSWNQKGKCK